MQLRPWESEQVKPFSFPLLAAGCVTSEEVPKPSESQSSPFSEKGSGPTSYEWSEVARERNQRQVGGKCSCLSCSPALQHLGLFMCSYSSHGAPPSQKRKPMRTGWEMGRSNHQSAIMWGLVQPLLTPCFPRHQQSACSKTFQRILIDHLRAPENLTTVFFPGITCPQSLQPVIWG